MTIQSLKYILAGLIISALMVTCGKDDPGAEPKDVFVAGYVMNDKVAIATYWKNGIATSLPSGPFGAVAFAIAVNGSDVYVAGYITNSDRVTAIYWKNGVPTSLSDHIEGSSAAGIALNGNDVYVAGFGIESSSSDNYVNCWKNNTPIKISHLNNSQIEGLAISFSALGDIYIAGNEYAFSNANCPNASFARYWKNGNLIPLPTKYPCSQFPNTITPVPAGSPNSRATAIAVNGSDVYVAGSDGNVGVYWKNGILVSSLNGDNASRANAIAVNRNDVFVAGWGSESGAKYWKNGVAVKLAAGANRADNSEAYGMAVFGAHVYVAGFEYENSVSIAKYWKDGVAVRLTDGIHRGRATAIVVR